MNILGVDVGESRIGLALANNVVKIPAPYKILKNDEEALCRINEIVTSEQISTIVVGLPRNMSGEETKQSAQVREWAENLRDNITLPIVFSDESLSSVRAEKLQGYDPKRQSGQPVDDLAACFILEEFFMGVKSE